MIRVSRLICLAALATTVACGSDSTTAPSTTSSAPYSQIDLVVGTGATAAVGNSITVSYTGWFYDSTKADGKGSAFQQAAGFKFVLGVGQVIKGWDQGVVGMRVGGTRRLILPPELAYGSAGSGSIPPNATLVFEVALTSIP
jgi:FKBP-type peptidyl-prolyl cis-trans isomerase FkpA